MGNLEPKLHPALDPDPLVRDEWEYETSRYDGYIEYWRDEIPLSEPKYTYDDLVAWAKGAQRLKVKGYEDWPKGWRAGVRKTIALRLRYIWPRYFGREAVHKEWLKAKREHQ